MGPISENLKQATNQAIAFDKNALEIADLEDKIDKLEFELKLYKRSLSNAKDRRPDISIRWRDSIKWCLKVDSINPKFFLKSTSGVYTCIAFKHKVDITSDMKNKISVTLAALYKEKTIGRYEYNGIFIYGLPQFFNDDLTDLTEESKSKLDGLFL